MAYFSTCIADSGCTFEMASKVTLDRAYCEVCETFGHSTDDCNVGLDDGEDDLDAGGGDDDDFY